MMSSAILGYLVGILIGQIIFIIFEIIMRHRLTNKIKKFNTINYNQQFKYND